MSNSQTTSSMGLQSTTVKLLIGSGLLSILLETLGCRTETSFDTNWKFQWIDGIEGAVLESEITQQQWLEVMGTEPWSFFIAEDAAFGRGDLRRAIGPNHPAIFVSFNDATQFCQKLSATDHRFVFRLPTEDEYEFYCGGKNYLENRFDYAKTHAIMWPVNIQAPEEVKKRNPNTMGLYDTIGNVWEWVSSPNDGYKVIAKGGGFSTSPLDFWPTNRLVCRPDDRFATIGFRIIRVNR